MFHFGFSYIGLIWLFMLMVPNLVWVKNKSVGYEESAAKENKVLLMFERIGHIGIHIKETDLMMIGLQTNFCIDATVKSAFEKGYNMIVPQEANSTFDNYYMNGESDYRYYNEMMWPKRFATCTTVDEAILTLSKSDIQF